MSDVAIAQGQAAEGPFNPRAMLAIVAIGILAFIAMLVLGAYAPDLKSGRNGGAHALSNAATGFSGLVQLAEATRRSPRIVRSEGELKNEDLVVVTPDDGSTNLSKLLAARGPRATLLVLPKWQTSPDKMKAGWVRVSGLLDPSNPEMTLAPSVKMVVGRSKGQGKPLDVADTAMPRDVDFVEPKVVQWMTGEGLEPLINTSDGKLVLARVGSRNLYVLSDPDLLNNHGMANQGQARAALALLDYLNSTDADAVLFDVTTNGLGRSRSPLKLAFDAPFLGVTLTIFAAMLLAAWQALNRFGPPRQRERAIAFGKAALVDNSAALVRKAGREARLGSRYVDVVRERAVQLFRMPPMLDRRELDERLESLNPDRSFAAAARAASEARTRGDLLGAARSLNDWLEEVRN